MLIVLFHNKKFSFRKEKAKGDQRVFLIFHRGVMEKCGYGNVVVKVDDRRDLIRKKTSVLFSALLESILRIHESLPGDILD